MNVHQFIDHCLIPLDSWLTPIMENAYHHSRSDRYAPATVGIRNNVTIANTQEGDGDQPHCVQQIRVLLIMVSKCVIKDEFINI